MTHLWQRCFPWKYLVFPEFTQVTLSLNTKKLYRNSVLYVGCLQGWDSGGQKERRGTVPETESVKTVRFVLSGSQQRSLPPEPRRAGTVKGPGCVCCVCCLYPLPYLAGVDTRTPGWRETSTYVQLREWCCIVEAPLTNLLKGKPKQLKVTHSKKEAFVC